MNLAGRLDACPPTRGGGVVEIQDPSIMNVDASCNTVGIRVCTVVGDCGIRLREAEAVAAGVPWATLLFMGCGDIARASRSADVKGPANELAV